MDQSKAIEMIKDTIDEIPYLRTLRYDNQEFKLWYDRVCNILEAAFDKGSGEYDRFTGAVRVYWGKSNAELQRAYNSYLGSYETALKSIIQKYEILGVETESSTKVEPTLKAFISHGRESVSLPKVKTLLKALGVEPISVEEQPSLDRTVDDKVNYYLDQADFVVILATGDDEIEGKLHPRQNVIHEIGLAQKTYAGKIIYLLEEGVEFPSNIRPRVWKQFNQDNMENVFLYIIRELKAIRSE